MGRRQLRYAIAAVLVLSLIGASVALAANRGQRHHKGSNEFEAILLGHNEVPLSIHTAAKGELSLTINADNTMSFELTYSGLSSPASAAHVHFGQPYIAGGVSFFLCGGGSKPACPAGTTTPADVKGTIVASDVLGPTNQGIAAGDFGAIAQEIRDGVAYANVHSQTYPGGEIRGQLFGSHDRGLGLGFKHHDHD